MRAAQRWGRRMDWVMGLVGGLMIGAAGAMMLLINGRIMGISLLDHIIFNRSTYYSFLESGTL